MVSKSHRQSSVISFQLSVKATSGTGTPACVLSMLCISLDHRQECLCHRKFYRGWACPARGKSKSNRKSQKSKHKSEEPPNRRPVWCVPTRIDLNSQPSPPWGRGWTATGVFSSRGGPGEGVKAVARDTNWTQYGHYCCQRGPRWLPARLWHMHAHACLW